MPGKRSAPRPYASASRAATNAAMKIVSRRNHGMRFMAKCGVRRPCRRSDSGGMAAALQSPSYFFRLVLPEQAAWPEQQYPDEDHERDGVAEVREPAPADEGLDDPDRQPAYHRPRHVADAAEHRGDEGLEAGHDPHQRIDLRIREAEEDAGDGGERGADDERRRDHAVDGDAHQRRDLEVVRHRAHGPA